MDSWGDAEKRRADLGGGSASDAAGWPFAAERVPSDSRLSAPPRRVPTLFVVAELLPFRWWYLLAMFVIAVPAAILWATEPAAALPVALGTLVLIYLWQFRGSAARLRLLRRGQVATVTDVEIVSRASYYGGVTWYNAPLPVAHGWRVTRPLWSGPSTTTDIRYVLDGHDGRLRLRGREYVDGVILADPRSPDRARCVTFFPYDLDRDGVGNWLGRLRPRLMLGMAVWSIVVCAWVVGATAISTGHATHTLRQAQTIHIAPGSSATVSGSSLNRQVDCDRGNLTVDGIENVITVSGHCASLTVTGIRNTITLDTVDAVSISGIDGRVVYHSGTPSIANSGINNTATHG